MRPDCDCWEYDPIWKEWIFYSTVVGNKQWQAWWKHCPECGKEAVKV